MDTHPSLAVYIWRASLWFHDRLQVELRKRGVIPTTRTQGHVFACIALGEARPSRLARFIGVSPQAMSQILAGMVEVDMISLDPDPNDARARIVRLTPAGVEHLSIVRALMHRLEAALERRFGKPVIDVMRMVLEAEWGDDPIAIDDDRIAEVAE